MRLVAMTVLAEEVETLSVGARRDGHARVLEHLDGALRELRAARAAQERTQ